MVEGGNVADFANMYIKRWHRSLCEASSRDLELVDFEAKSGCGPLTVGCLYGRIFPRSNFLNKRYSYIIVYVYFRALLIIHIHSFIAFTIFILNNGRLVYITNFMK